MKRFFLFLFLFSAFCLSSCQKGSFLSYQENDFTLVCTVNDVYRCQIQKTGVQTVLTVLEPSTVANVQFFDNDNERYLICDTVKIPVSQESASGFCALLDAFSQSEEFLIQTEGKNKLLFSSCPSCPEQSVITTITLENSLPREITVVSETFSYRLTDISFQP